jgi:peptidoglycan/LPS O-acetylase OafA/YrhL
LTEPRIRSATTANRRFPLGDPLRAVAMLGVVACHSSPAAIGRFWWGGLAWNGQVGVDVFFALSGFLLYRPYLAARVTGRPEPRTRPYLRHRALRILPAYWVALTVLAIWPGLPGVFTGDWWRYYGLLQIYPLGHPGQGLGVAWTLCVEVSFYAALPLYAALLSRLAPTSRRSWLSRELLVLAALSLASAAVRYGIFFERFPGWVGTAIVGQFDYFAIGMVVALASCLDERSARVNRLIRLVDRLPGVFFAGAAFLFVAMWRIAPRPDPTVPILHLVGAPISYVHEEANHWLIAAMTLMLLAPVVFGDSRRGLSRRVLGARPLIWLGSISYGVYLWHDPLLTSWIAPAVGARRWLWIGGTPVPELFILTLAVVAPIAWLSYRVIERPLLRRGREP